MEELPVNSIEPYAFEPLLTMEEIETRRQQREEPQRGEEENRADLETRIGNNEWCLCCECPAMTTAKESICCKEVSKAATKMGSVHSLHLLSMLPGLSSLGHKAM